MPKLERITRLASTVALVSIACIAAACGRPASSPVAGSPADPGPTAPGPGSSAAPPGRPGTPRADELCDVAECGPAMGMPVRRCSDGSIGGPTGRCLRRPDGKCGWEVRPCPPG